MASHAVAAKIIESVKLAGPLNEAQERILRCGTVSAHVTAARRVAQWSANDRAEVARITEEAFELMSKMQPAIPMELREDGLWQNERRLSEAEVLEIAQANGFQTSAQLIAFLQKQGGSHD